MPTAWEREQARRQKEEELAAGEAEAAKRNRAIERVLTDLDSILRSGITRTDLPSNYDARKIPIPQFQEASAIVEPEPRPEDFHPGEPGLLARGVPGWRERYERRVAKAQHDYHIALQDWRDGERERARARAGRRKVHESIVRETEERNRRVDELAADARKGKQYAVEDYVRVALSTGVYPAGVTQEFNLRFLPSRTSLLLETEFPLAADIIPVEASWRYNKTRRELQVRAKRTDAATARLYKATLAQLTLRAIYESLTADVFGHIQTVCFNGVVSHVDPTNGRPTRSRLVSLRIDRDEFLDRDFTRLDAVKALKSLRANFSDSPVELTPIPAIIEFDPSDPRLIEEQDILSTLKEGMNLLDLTPDAFEQLVTNLFKKMGFDAYPTRRSKDGGVDCIAYYKKSVLSGKYSIQAKLWTNTIQVDAVRDLFGAMHHERANTGILITTSKFAPACYKFAEDKPLRLIDGSELLDLFEKHTDLKVRIVFPPKRT
jgi:restriction system protein